MLSVAERGLLFRLLSVTIHWRGGICH